MISVHVHRHNPATGRPGAVKSPLTPYGLRWSASVNPPWGGLVASFDASFGSLRDMPIAGDWLVARNGKKHLAWGRVVDPGSAGVALQGKTPAPNIINVVATNWLNLLAKSQVTVTELRRESVGTLLSYGDWRRRWQEITTHQLSKNGHVGSLLAETFVALAEIALPESLGGGLLSERIEILYNGKQDPSGTRVLDPVIGWTQHAAAAHAPRDTAVMDILMGTFVPDRRLVEIFPSDEPAANRRTNLGGVLGDVNPALIYRLKPWRAHALGDVVTRNLVGRSGGGDALRGAERFATPSWRPASAATVDWPEVELFDVSANDEMRCNAVSVGLPSSPQSPEALSEAAGLPAMDAHDIRGHGLRMETVYWPFFDYETGGSSFDAMRLVASLGAQIMFGGHRYRAGKVRLTRLRTDIRHGELVKIGDFTAYVETVEHTAVNVGSTPTGQTTLTVSRGLFGWEEDVRRPTIELTQGDPADFSRQFSNAGESSAEAAAEQGATAVKKDIIYHRGKEYPINLAAKGLPGVWWMPIVGVKDPGHRRGNGTISRVELHYSVGSHGETPASLQGFFQKFYTEKAADPSKELRSVHFAIGKSGEIYQYIDTSFTAYHDGDDRNNTPSIGIDLINPFNEGKASRRKSSAWPAVTVPWKIQRPGGRVVTVTDFFGPTARQLDALAVLLAALTELPTTFNLNGRSGTNVLPSVGPLLKTYPSGTSLASGVYHHAELNAEKKDCVGVDITALVAAASALVRT